MSGRGRRALLGGAARSASGAVGAQVVVAGGSLAVQVFAARVLGAADFGTVALVVGLLVLGSVASQGLIGDALAVLDRTDPSLRRALTTVQAGLLAAALVTGLLAGALLAPGGLVAPLLGLLLALWILEELGRRLFIARSDFRGLVLNDVAYVAATLLTLLAWSLLAAVTLVTVLLAMTLGSAVAVLAAAVQLPATEWRPARPGLVGLGTLMSFSGWRTAQLVTRPLVLLAMRVLIAATAGRAALGAVEAARLLMAPALTVIAGFGSFLLPRLSAQSREGRPSGTLLRASTALLVAGSAVSGAVALLLVEPLGRLLTGGTFVLSPVAVLGWAVYACAFAATMPVVLWFTVRQRNRYVFGVRLVEYAAGLVGVAAVLLLAQPSWAPLALAAGGVLAAGVLWRRAGQLRPDVAAEAGAGAHGASALSSAGAD